MIQYGMARSRASKLTATGLLLLAIFAGVALTGTRSAPLAAALKSNQDAQENKSAEHEVRRAAIFVRNRVQGLDGRVGVLQDLLSARVTGEARFSIVSRENVINSVRAMAEEGPNVGHDVDPKEDLDRILSNRASALRLGQLMQADYILIASITSYTSNTHHVRQQNVDQRIRQEHLMATYEIVDTALGGTLAANVARVEKRTRLAGYEVEPDNINDLLDDASKQLASALAEQVKRKEIRQRAGRPELVPLTVFCTIEDLTIPDVVRDENGDWVIAKDRHPMTLMDVTIELNGAAEGSAPGTVRVEPGLSRLRLSRTGFRPIEQTVNIRQETGLELSVAMQMTDETRHRMLENMAFFEDLRINQKLTDAHVEVLEGYAQMLRQSGYRVDIKHDITIDTDEPPRVEQTVQSFWANN